VFDRVRALHARPPPAGIGLRGAGIPGVEILGTDLNRRVLFEARRAEYREFAFRSTPSCYREKYFRREAGRYRLDPSIRSMVRFRSFNLLQPTGLPEGPFHGVLCRNVLIYFDAEAKRRAVDLLTRSLRPDGVLVVGRAESLVCVSGAPGPCPATGSLCTRGPGRDIERHRSPERPPLPVLCGLLFPPRGAKRPCGGLSEVAGWVDGRGRGPPGPSARQGIKSFALPSDERTGVARTAGRRAARATSRGRLVESLLP